MSGIKTAAEIEIIKQGGKQLGAIRDELLAHIKAGTIPIDIDNLAKKLIKEAGGTPSFMTVNDYQWATCISVNEGVVHGVPDHRPFKDGDVVSLDVGLLYKGWHTDTSWTKLVSSSQSAVNSNIEKFLRVGEEALKKAIEQARPGNRIGHISRVIQETVERAGYSIVKSLVGHGVGKTLHEEPQIPGFLAGDIKKTPELKVGMIIAIEVIFAQGRGVITHANNDGWTLVTKDGSLAGLFEETIWVSDQGPRVLTRSYF